MDLVADWNDCKKRTGNLGEQLRYKTSQSFAVFRFHVNEFNTRPTG
jgi:hypothetical protein